MYDYLDSHKSEQLVTYVRVLRRPSEPCTPTYRTRTCTAGLLQIPLCKRVQHHQHVPLYTHIYALLNLLSQVPFLFTVRKNLKSGGPLVFSHTSVHCIGFKIAIFAFDSSLLWWKNNISRGSSITGCKAHVPCGGPSLTDTRPQLSSCNVLVG